MSQPSGDEGVLGMHSNARGRAALIVNRLEFDRSDAAILRRIQMTGSLAKAAESLGRSRSRVANRIDTLEAEFGDLVDRRRGGSDGGGSALTPDGIDLLRRFDRFLVAIDATISVPETVLSGTITAVDDELATVETDIGEIDGIHGGLDGGSQVQASIAADAITIHVEETQRNPATTSARNCRVGTVSALQRGTRVVRVDIAVEAMTMPVLITSESVTRLSLKPGDQINLSWKATATRVIPISTEPR